MKEINLIPNDLQVAIRNAQDGKLDNQLEELNTLYYGIAFRPWEDMFDDKAFVDTIRGIGDAIHRRGGLRLMQLTYYRLLTYGDGSFTRDHGIALQSAWHGVGEWQS